MYKEKTKMTPRTPEKILKLKFQVKIVIYFTH